MVSNCEFPTATSGFELLHGTGGIKSGGRGIFLHNFFGAVNNYNDVVDFTGGNRPGQPIVQFIDNVFTGSGDDELDLDGTDAWVEHNIFLHTHKNGSPDTASGISGGDNGNDTSEITIIGNIFYDCDQAAMAKQGDFYTFINNTVVHQTHTGGTDTEGGVVCLEDGGVADGRGMYLEGNIVFDAEQLVRNLNSATVTFNNNLMPYAWGGPGSGNSTANPMLAHIPQVADTDFANWTEAQVMWDWFSLLPGSPGIGTGPNGLDMGAVVPMGCSVSGAPTGTTTDTSATLVVGINRTGNAIPTSSWSNGSGYVSYKWRLDTNAWSAETPINTPITLTGLEDGPHYVEVTGKRDCNMYQDDPDYGVDAVITRTPTWTVQTHVELRILSAVPAGNSLTLTFEAEAGKTYSLLRANLLPPDQWTPVANVDAPSTNGVQSVTDPNANGALEHFYRIVTPAMQ